MPGCYDQGHDFQPIAYAMGIGDVSTDKSGVYEPIFWLYCQRCSEISQRTTRVMNVWKPETFQIIPPIQKPVEEHGFDQSDFNPANLTMINR